jgi:hypothetical protein
VPLAGARRGAPDDPPDVGGQRRRVLEQDRLAVPGRSLEQDDSAARGRCGRQRPELGASLYQRCRRGRGIDEVEVPHRALFG